MLSPLSNYVVLKLTAIKKKTKNMQEAMCLLLRKKPTTKLQLFVDGMVVFLEIARDQLKTVNNDEVS